MTIPVAEITSSPGSFINLQTANFVVNVKDSVTGDALPSALLYWQLDGNSVPTSIGTGRTISFSGLTNGAHVVLFDSQMDGIYASSPTRYEWNVDTTIPSISTIIPQNNSDAIGLRSPITIYFSETMDVASVEASVSFSPNIPGVWSNIDQKDFTYTPSVNMSNLQVYTVTISIGAKDRANNHLLAPVVSRFTTIQQINRLPNTPNFTNIINPDATSDANPRVVFNVPVDIDNDALHFSIEFATNISFANIYRVFDSINNAANFTYYDNSGNRTSPFPVNGVAPGLGKVTFRAPEPFGDGEYWYRLFANDRR